MNKVFLIGNLTRDPELSETNSGVSVCHFGLAVNRGYSSSQDQERQVDFFNVTAWRGTADNVARFCKKGSKVAVSGSIQLRTYEDNAGQRRTAVDIIANEVEFLMPKNSAGSDDGDFSAPAAPSPRKKPALEAFDDDSDIPF